jgi:hypothetical protein
MKAVTRIRPNAPAKIRSPLSKGPSTPETTAIIVINERIETIAPLCNPTSLLIREGQLPETSLIVMIVTVAVTTTSTTTGETTIKEANPVEILTEEIHVTPETDVEFTKQKTYQKLYICVPL